MSTNYASITYQGGPTKVLGPDYAPDTDTLSFTFYGENAAHLVKVVLHGPEEQRKFLDNFDPVMRELRRRLASSGGVAPSAA